MVRLIALTSAVLLNLMLTSTSHGSYRSGHHHGQSNNEHHHGQSNNELDPAVISRLLPTQEIARFVEKAILERRAMIPQLAARGVPSLGIPSFDPAAVGDVPVNFTMDVVRLEGNFSDVQAVGLRDLKLLDVRVKLPGLLVEADVRIPELRISGRYFLDGSFSDIFPLTGSGPLELSLKDVDLKLIAQTRLYYDRLHIARVDFTIAIANSSVKLGGFLEDAGFGDLAQQFLEDMSGDFLRTAIKRFREKQFPSLVQRGNKFLRSYDWRQLLPNAVALYLGFEQSSSGYHGYTPTATNNKLVGRIVQQIASYFSHRSFNVPNQDLLTKKKFFKWTLRNGVRLLPGKLFGLDSLTLVGDALISRHQHIFTFDMDLALFNLKIVLPSELVIMNKRKRFLTFAHISRMKINIQLQLDSQYLSLRLLALHILHIGDIRVDISGLGPLELVAAPVAEYKINLEKNKRLLARQAAQMAGASVSLIIGRVDLNSVLADALNGRVYAVDPGIVFPDPDSGGSGGSDFSSLLNSALGVEEGGAAGGGLNSLLGLLIGGGDDDGDGGEDDLSQLDEETLAAFGLTGSGPDDSDEDPLAGLGPDVLAAFGLTGSEPDESEDDLAGVDADVLAAFGLTGSEPDESEDDLAGVDADVLAAFGLTGSGPDESKDDLAGVDADVLAAFGLTGSGPDESKDDLTGVDADVLAAFGLSVKSAGSTSDKLLTRRSVNHRTDAGWSSVSRLVDPSPAGHWRTDAGWSSVSRLVDPSPAGHWRTDAG